MCGLCGAAGTLFQDDVNVFSQLLLISSLRGRDSTGVATATRHNYIKMRKEVYDSSYWLNREFGKSKILSTTADVIIGHCRAATVGTVTHQNAHPFDTGRYISAHNGTIVNEDIIEEAKKTKRTDSEVMFRMMERDGIKPVLARLSDKDAYAITMYDKETKELIFARNERRGLYIAVSEKRDSIFWASEFYMLKMVLNRQNPIIKAEVYFLHPGHIYRVKVSDITRGEEPWSSEAIRPEPEEGEKVEEIKNGQTEAGEQKPDFLPPFLTDPKPKVEVFDQQALIERTFNGNSASGFVCLECDKPIASGFMCLDCTYSGQIGRQRMM